MGCGGSRTDALEPRNRNLESWTKETESTWLASTDTDVPLSSIQSIPSESSSSDMGFISDKTANIDLFDDCLPAPAQAYLKVCSSMSEVALSRGDPKAEAKLGGGGGTIPPPNPPSPQDPAASPGTTTVEKRSVLRTEEITKWQDNKMSTKQVTITVTQSIRQVDKSGKIKEKSHTTYEVMTPVERLKDGMANSTVK
ncbi:brain and acute leukemia cytoplasmic protein [Engraulis encrasicolus]|uniref:brain and acute leukemia cytoplasmic protein n=1 Tax=Engraulis encrasicolus TaxID=184585 RepID=UPI002FD150C0